MLKGYIKYENLNNHFTLNKKGLSNFSRYNKVPRKLKKKIRNFCGIFYNSLEPKQRLWWYMEKSKPDYKRFLIKKICDDDTNPKYKEFER
jgi:hypothetical protein